MKISEMIAILEKAKAEHGELDVAVSIDSAYDGSCENFFDADAIKIVESEKELHIHVGYKIFVFNKI